MPSFVIRVAVELHLGIFILEKVVFYGRSRGQAVWYCWVYIKILSFLKQIFLLGNVVELLMFTWLVNFTPKYYLLSWFVTKILPDWLMWCMSSWLIDLLSKSKFFSDFGFNKWIVLHLTLITFFVVNGVSGVAGRAPII